MPSFRKKKSTTTKASSSKSSGTDLQALIAAAQTKGYKVPKEKVGILTRLGNVLSSFEPGDEIGTAIRSYKKTGDIGSALGEAGKQYGSEVLRGFGSAVPFLDKFTKPTELAAEREGFSGALTEAGWKPETKAGKFAKGAAGLAGDVVLDPGNLLMAPLLKKGLEGVGEVGKFAGKGLAKSDTGQDILATLAKGKKTLGKAFNATYGVDDNVAKFGKEITRSKALSKKKVFDEVTNFMKVNGEDAFEIARKEIELGGELSPATEALRKQLSVMAQEEVDLGLMKKILDNYFPRKVKRFPMGESYFSKSGLGADTSSSKLRKHSTKEVGKEAGVKYFSDAEAWTIRRIASEDAKISKGAFNKLVTGELKNVDGSSVVKKIGKEVLSPDEVYVILDKNGLRIGDKTIGFYPTLGEKGQKMVGVTTRKAKYKMNKDAAEYLIDSQKVIGNDEATRGILGIYDKIQNWWKASVTGPFPAFHTRNGLSNIFNNWIGGVTNPKSYLSAAEIQKGTGKLTPKIQKLFPDIKTFEELGDFLKIKGVTGGGQFAVDVPVELGKKVGKESLLKKIGAAPFRAGKVGGQAVENNARIAHFVEKINKGVGIDDAVKSVNKYLFDYSDLSKFEREVLKRIMPFYTFSRKNLPLQLEQLFKQPQKYKAVFDAVNSFKSSDLTPEEKRYLPDYLREKLGIPVGRDTEGMPKILSGMGLPFEELEKIGDPLSAGSDLLSPLIKFPLEKESGQSMFFDKPINDTSAYKYTTKFVGSIPGLKQWLEVKPRVNKAGQDYFEVNPNKMHTLKTLLGRVMNTGEKFTDVRMTLPERIMNVLSGLKIYSADIDRVKEDEIINMLKEMGVYKEFKTDYIPKDIKADLGM